MDRIVVLGRGGASKSVFARALGANIGAEVIELDKVFWSETLEPLTTDEWADRQGVLADRQRWSAETDQVTVIVEQLFLGVTADEAGVGLHSSFAPYTAGQCSTT